MTDNHRALPVIGWREYVSLPDFGLRHIKAKIDSGARSSSLHAFDIEEFEQADGTGWVRFKVHPLHRQDHHVVELEAPLLDTRHVRSSSGHGDHRPVILTTLEMMGQRWPIELTLADRSEMGFRMLVGREAMRGRFLIDPGRSFCCRKRRRKHKPGQA
ncbi:MAG: ATP-dependent zinc protease [Planctomycetota bacterium]|nr:MAG: ATP-dependent zinc protease [Planctomycetota bacterium]